MSRELDCPMGDGHLEADTDEELLSQARAHAAEAHPELTEEQLRGVVEQGARDKAP
jgi:hypothetical protein